jgi:trans-aconitate methyltransferase
MDSEAQTLAYAKADFNDSNALFTDSFLEHFADLPQTGRLVDLGCGPGDITIRLAQALPGWEITGLDAGPNMLRHARRLLGKGLAHRVHFQLARLPDPSLTAGAWDAVVSNSLLHHLPDPAVLWSSVNQLGAPGAAVQVMDLLRPDNEQQAEELVDRYAADAPAILREDFYNSLLAAYRLDEVREQLAMASLGQLSIQAASDRHWLVSGTLAD